ncbi:MAG: tRNA pseudouridine(38-40) synthase TruA [Ginsengibacter sp.]
MPRYFIEVSYKGTRYSGFQVQQNANTIQSEVEKALTIRFRQSFTLTGASRTDKGVHALQNYFHFDTTDGLASKNDTFYEKDLLQVLYSLNSILPDDIVIKRIFEVCDTEHCRFDAVSRRYKYYIYSKKNPFYKDTAYFYPYPIDLIKLQEAASIVLTTENFTSFSKRNTQVKNFICSIYKSQWQKKNDFIIYDVVANRFLRGMVRGLVGTMLRVGTGKISLIEFIEIIKNKNFVKVDFSVPAKGLYLSEIKYNI